MVTNDGSTPCFAGDRGPQREEPRQARVLDQQVVAGAELLLEPAAELAGGAGPLARTGRCGSRRADGRRTPGRSRAAAGRRGSRPPTATPRTPWGWSRRCSTSGCGTTSPSRWRMPASVLVPDRPVPATRTRRLDRTPPVAEAGRCGVRGHAQMLAIWAGSSVAEADAGRARASGYPEPPAHLCPRTDVPPHVLGGRVHARTVAGGRHRVRVDQRRGPVDGGDPGSDRDARARIVFVAGSGRSGTSLMSGILKHLGPARARARGRRRPDQPQGLRRAPVGGGLPRQAAPPGQRPARRRAPQRLVRRRPGRARASPTAPSSRLAQRASSTLADSLVIKDPRIPWFLGLWRVAAVRCGARPRRRSRCCARRPRWSAARTPTTAAGSATSAGWPAGPT